MKPIDRWALWCAFLLTFANMTLLIGLVKMNEKIQKPQQEYDYSLELRQDDGGCAWIEVRRDSSLFIVDPDSLEEFIIRDNL